MQSLSPSPEADYRSVRDGLRKMVNTEGIMRTIRGVNAVVLGAGPAHAMYFSAYEGIKTKLGSKKGIHTHFANATAGCGATLLHDAIMVPSEVIKQRMQMFNSPYRSCFDCMCKLYCEEGMRAFYRSYTTQMLMNLPFHASHIVMYEKMSQILNPSREYNPKVHMIAGAGAGAIASALTTPLDMCKTLLNTQESATLNQVNQTRVVGILDAFKTIYRMQGASGFLRGMHARVLYQMPGTAISWSTYELFKHLLKTNKIRNDSPHNLQELVNDDVVKSKKVLEKPETFHHQHTSYDGGTSVTRFGTEKLYAIGSSSSNTVEQIRNLPVTPSLTASCSAADKRNLFSK
ncbi:Mitoferrin-2 [Armadillidium nasatum]|uniref:Mitoferrin-2 n=1 Tax=Armadillidium nasatum TaxID=96803 RepID=A0A5N5SQX3_9CRUS|nr:Mitoferrin-2 [Armadillidium nasatum]